MAQRLTSPSAEPSPTNVSPYIREAWTAAKGSFECVLSRVPARLIEQPERRPDYADRPGAHEGAALPPGEAPRDQGPLEDEQGPAQGCSHETRPLSWAYSGFTTALVDSGRCRLLGWLSPRAP